MKDHIVATITFLVFGFLAMFASYLALEHVIPSPGCEIVIIVLGLLAGIHAFRATLRRRKGTEISATIQQTPPPFGKMDSGQLHGVKMQKTAGARLALATLIGLAGLVGVVISAVWGFLVLIVAQEKAPQKMVEVIFVALLFLVSGYCCCFALAGRHIGQPQSGITEAGRTVMATFLRVSGLLGIAVSLFAELVLWAFAAGKPETKIGDGCLWGLVFVISVIFSFLGSRLTPRNS